MSSLLEGSFAKETYIFKEPTNRSHPIAYAFFQWYIRSHEGSHITHYFDAAQGTEKPGF